MKQTDKIISSIRKSCAQTSLGVGIPRFYRKDRRVTNEINSQKNATSDAGSYTKSLIHTKSGPYHKISELVAETRRYHEDMTSPTKVRGVRIIASKNYLDYVEGVRSRQDTFNSLKRQFLEEYEKYIDESQNRLGDMFDRSDYPHPAAIAERFYFESSCSPLPDNDGVEMFVSGEELHEMKEKLEADMLENVNRNQRNLWEQMYKTIDKIADKCSKEIGSKGAVFKDKNGRGMISDLVKLCDLIPKKDILGDPELELIRKKVEETLLVNPEDLRVDPSKREEIAGSAGDILDSMATYMGYKPETDAERKAKADQLYNAWTSCRSETNTEEDADDDTTTVAQRFAEYF